MKSWKGTGVPLGARIVFTLQHIGFVVGAILMAPILFVRGLLHPSGAQALDNMIALVEDRMRAVKVQQLKLIRMYSKDSEGPEA